MRRYAYCSGYNANICLVAGKRIVLSSPRAAACLEEKHARGYQGPRGIAVIRNAVFRTSERAISDAGDDSARTKSDLDTVLDDIRLWRCTLAIGERAVSDDRISVYCHE